MAFNNKKTFLRIPRVFISRDTGGGHALTTTDMMGRRVSRGFSFDASDTDRLHDVLEPMILGGIDEKISGSRDRRGGYKELFYGNKDMIHEDHIGRSPDQKAVPLPHVCHAIIIWNSLRYSVVHVPIEVRSKYMLHPSGQGVYTLINELGRISTRETGTVPAGFRLPTTSAGISLMSGSLVHCAWVEVFGSSINPNDPGESYRIEIDYDDYDFVKNIPIVVEKTTYGVGVLDSRTGLPLIVTLAERVSKKMAEKVLFNINGNPFDCRMANIGGSSGRMRYYIKKRQDEQDAEEWDRRIKGMMG
jgi:hypothetical protein